MTRELPQLGLGIGWRPELALAIDRRPDLGFVELMAEDFTASAIPPAVDRLRQKGLRLIPHGVSLSLGSAQPPEPRRLEALARLAERVAAPLVSEHLAFVRAGGIETGHLLPLPRTRETLDLMVSHVRQAQAALPVPLALENIATLIDWPDDDMNEADFLAELLERTDALLLLDVENVYANARNRGIDPLDFIDRLDLSRIAYIHVAGGVAKGALYHDTHTFPVSQPVLDLLEEVCARAPIPGMMLERDDCFPGAAELNAELDALAGAIERGVRRRKGSHVSR